MSNTDGCVAGCKAAACGDGFVQAGVEQCDDGNAVPNDACNNMCTCGQTVVEVDIPFANTVGWTTNGCCGPPAHPPATYRVSPGTGQTISGSFVDPTPVGSAIVALELRGGVEHSCTAGNSLSFRYENSEVGAWGSANGPDCACGNTAVGDLRGAAEPLQEGREQHGVDLHHQRGRVVPRGDRHRAGRAVGYGVPRAHHLLVRVGDGRGAAGGGRAGAGVHCGLMIFWSRPPG
jgi:cysteine-rich repeat protein